MHRVELVDVPCVKKHENFDAREFLHLHAVASCM